MSTDQAIEVKHGDVLITYHEQDDVWRFTLRGRDRSADSLAKAKEFIDKPVPKDKAKPFEKIPAWWFRYSEPPKPIEVTGIGEHRGYGGGQMVWINHKGTRSKESEAFAIYPRNEKNDALVAEILAKRTEAQRLRDEADELKQKLAPLVLPKDE